MNRSWRLACVAAFAATIAGCGGGGGGGANAPVVLTYTIGGTVEGLPAGVTVTLANASDTLGAASGAFTFATAVSAGGSYSVGVANQPSGYRCTVASATGNNVSANVTSVSVTCAAVPVSAAYFAEQANAFPDLAPLFAGLCGANTLVQTVVAADLNHDGRMDLVFDAWCDLNGRGLSQLMGTPYNGAIPNTLVLLLQQADGTFKLENKRLFGSDLIPLSGPGNLAVGDFNGDGFIDIVVAPSKEDGRNPVNFPDGSNNYMAPTQVLLSKADGTYAISEVGPPLPGGSRLVFKSSQNRDVMAFAGNVYTYGSGTWSSQASGSLLNPQSVFAQQGGLYAINEMVDVLPSGSTYAFGLSLNQQNADQTWSRVDAFALATMAKVPTSNQVGQTLELTDQFLATIAGQDWLIPSIGQGCALSSTAYVTLLEGIPLATPYSTGQVLSFNTLLSQYTSRLLLANLQGGKITSFAVMPNSAVPDLFALSCQDVNRDGQQDIVVTRWADGRAVAPYVFLAGVGGFSLVSNDKLPTSPSSYHGVASYVVDIDGDGLADVIYYPLLGMTTGYTGATTPKLFKGLKALD